MLQRYSTNSRSIDWMSDGITAMCSKTQRISNTISSLLTNNTEKGSRMEWLFNTQKDSMVWWKLYGLCTELSLKPISIHFLILLLRKLLNFSQPYFPYLKPPSQNLAHNKCCGISHMSEPGLLNDTWTILVSSL